MSPAPHPEPGQGGQREWESHGTQRGEAPAMTWESVGIPVPPWCSPAADQIGLEAERSVGAVVVPDGRDAGVLVAAA